MTAATYNAPGIVAPTSAVTFQYDSAGMRTLMDDGPGQVTYQYNSLNRLISETRTFDAIANKSFTLTYGYNLAGQLTTLTDPASDTISYNRDKAGRVTSITGSPYAGVTSYASGIQYRAWNSPKAVAYGNGFTASAKFTKRMQVQEFDIPGLIGGTYTYNNDGQLSTFVPSTAQYAQYDPRMNRTFGYDEFGRLNSSVTGGYDSFKANYNPQQDEFGNVKNASYHYWQNSNAAVSFNATYQNNRVVPNTVTDSGQTQTWNYDAMGNRTSVVSTINGTPTTVESINIDAVGRGAAAGATLDGEGQTAAFQGNYFIRSTIFGGEILTTVDLSGSKTKGRILDGASLLAEQIQYSNGQSVVWHHRDPLNLVARDAEAGQVKRRAFAITPNGAQVETNEGVNMATYYPCLFANNTPSCTGYNPQAIAGYGAAVNQINGLLGSGIKVDGALTLASLSDIARQNQRTGNGSILFSTALFGTPIGASIGVTAGSWQKRQVWTDIDTGDPTDIRARDDSYYEFVPGGVVGTGFGLIGGQQGGKAGGQIVEPPSQLRKPYPCITAESLIKWDDLQVAMNNAFAKSQKEPMDYGGTEFGGWAVWDKEKRELIAVVSSLKGILLRTLNATPLHPTWEEEKAWELYSMGNKNLVRVIDFHTHPSGNGRSDGDAVSLWLTHSRPLAIVVQGIDKWSIYDGFKTMQEATLEEKRQCLPLQ